MIAYVSDQGSDAGACTATAPCKTFAFVASVIGSRTWIHILGTSYAAGASSIIIPSTVTKIDSDNAVVTNDGAHSLFTTTGSSVNVTLQSIVLGTMGIGAFAIDVGGGMVTVDHAQILQPFNTASGATLLVQNSVLSGIGPCTTSGTTTVRTSTIQIGMTESGGVLTYNRNLFNHPTARALTIVAGTGVAENSIFVSSGASVSVVDVSSQPFQIFFDTFVNLQASTTTPITCEASPMCSVSSSILGWNATDLANCQVSKVIYPGAPTDSHPGGVGADLNAVFVDQVNKDFHLKANSPALRAGATGLSDQEDYEGSIRPNPVGTNPDIGAYESAN